jgi:hypothetical protein
MEGCTLYASTCLATETHLTAKQRVTNTAVDLIRIKRYTRPLGGA